MGKRIDKILGMMQLQRKPKEEIKNNSFGKSRSLKAGEYSRYRNNWTMTPMQILADIKNGGAKVLARAQSAAFNNPIVAGWLLDGRYWVTGPEGLDLQPGVVMYDGKTPDEYANNILKRAWKKFQREEYFSLCRGIDGVQAQWLMSDYFRVSGAVFMRMRISADAVEGNPFGLCFEFLDINDLDISYSAELMNGDTVLMGIKVDKFKRIKSMFFKNRSVISELRGSINYYEREEIPIEELIYKFDLKHHKQKHPISPLIASLIKLEDVDMWTDYAMQNAKGSAGKMGFLETIPNTVSEQYEGPKDKNGNEEEADDIGGTYMEIRGGTVEELPAGKKFAQYAPNYPHEQHTPFVRTNGREIARGVGGDYTAMYGDRENESFSSTKAGEQENRASNFYHQSLIRRVENKIYEIFVRYALLYNQLGNLKYSSIDRYLENYYFWGITKPWLDPYKESVSNEINKRNGWVSDNQVIQSNGGRMEDVFADKKMKMDYEKKFGFKLEEPKETPAVNDKQKDDTNKKDDASKDDNAENVDDNAKRNLKIMKM